MGRYSGRSLNDLGFYYECEEINNANYIIFSIQDYPPIVLGLCLPKDCTVDDLWEVIHKNFTLSLQNHIQKVTLEYSNSIEISENNQHIKKERKLTGNVIKDIIKPSHGVKSAKDMDSFAIGILCFMSLIFIICLSATWYEIKYKRPVVRMRRKSRFLDADPEKIVISSFVHMEEQEKHWKYEKYVLAWSIYGNIKKLFSTEGFDKKNPLNCVNAIKVLSIAWVCFGHTELYRAQISVVLNVDDLGLYTKHVYFSFVYGGQLAVDSFFWVSGLLQGVIMTKKLAENSINRGVLVLNRVFRVLPLFLMIILLSWALVKYIGNGPRWYFADGFMHRGCKDYFWTYVLLINNFVIPKDNNNCLVGSWYIPNDVQFFIIALIIIHLYVNKSRIYGWVLIFFTISFSILTTIIIAYDEHLEVNLLKTNPSSYLNDFYYKPYCRIAPYLLGLLTGFIYYSKSFSESSEKFDNISSMIIHYISKKSYIRITMYLLGLFLINLTIFVQHDTYDTNAWTRSQNAVFLGFSRLTWPLGLSLIFLPMILGQASILRPFFQSIWWMGTSRLVFCVYLLHMVIGQVYFFSQPMTYFYSQTNLIMDSLFILIMSFVIAIPLVLLIEMPCHNIQKLLLGN
ncbi:hypothetical protein SteCoe_27728 [Stentor coeruleus]|uniref:Acyltransferase 3 domain-containing protein n=1 Tax=Stentor coeruleus TaxID=5963 RepID=A0A1R2B9X1_9CILI|nr:hypothetical protein SteCoe_27728 [Stentor coeruleus]